MKYAIVLLLILISGLTRVEPVTAQVQAFGSSLYGQIGDGTRNTHSLPFDIGLPDVTTVSAGWYHTFFIKADGTMLATGRNNYGQLGVAAAGDKLSPVPVINLTDVVAVSGGLEHSLALKADGTVWAWGRNSSGQLGDNSLTHHSAPAQVAGLSDIVAIDAGSNHSLAIKSDGTLWAWGGNLQGQLGLGVTDTTGCWCRKTPVRVTALSGLIAVGAGGDTSIALKSNGTVWTWGETSSGQLGNGTTVNNPCDCTPNPQQSSISGVVQIAAGLYHNVALKSDGTVWIWGDNTYGQIGRGTSGGAKQLSPYNVGGWSDVVEISTNIHHTLIKRRDGSVWAWGANGGNLGNGTVVLNGCYCTPTPVQSSVGAGNALINAGGTHSFVANPNPATPTGTNVRLRGQNADIIFDNVTAAGTTATTAIDPTTTGLTVPGNHVIRENSAAYNISTTAVFEGSATICLKASTVVDELQFNRLRLLHGEGMNLVDRTVSRNYATREICAQTTSFSPFVIAEHLAPTAATANISGRVTTLAGKGTRGIDADLIFASGETRTVKTNFYGYFQFTEIPVGENYILQIRSKKYEFTPAMQVLFLTENVEGLNFTVLPITLSF